MRKNQNRRPLVEALEQYTQDGIIPFHTPGHKQGRNMDGVLATVIGSELLQQDLTEVEGLDNLHQPEGVIREAQELAADLMGAQESWFLIGGKAAGYFAALTAALNPGDSFLVDRHVHPDVWKASKLGRFKPIFLPAVSVNRGSIFLPVSADDIREGLKQYPEVKAIFVSSMTRTGLLTRLSDIQEICLEANQIMIVEESANPISFLLGKEMFSAGIGMCDIVIQTDFPVAGYPAQGGMIHRGTERVSSRRIQTALQIIQSTSPSYLIMGALDSMRHELWRCGAPEVNDLRQIITYISHQYTGNSGELGSLLTDVVGGNYIIDPMKMVVCFKGAVRTTKESSMLKHGSNYVVFAPKIGRGRINPDHVLSELHAISPTKKETTDLATEIRLGFFSGDPEMSYERSGISSTLAEAGQKRIAQPFTIPGSSGGQMYPGEMLTDEIIHAVGYGYALSDMFVEIMREV